MSTPQGLIQRLGRIELENDRGDFSRLEETWQEQTVVLTFIRHFG